MFWCNISNVNPGLIDPWAVYLGAYHLSIRLWLLEEYPLINKPWYINPGLTLYTMTYTACNMSTLYICSRMWCFEQCWSEASEFCHSALATHYFKGQERRNICQFRSKSLVPVALIRDDLEFTPLTPIHCRNWRRFPEVKVTASERIRKQPRVQRPNRAHLLKTQQGSARQN